jgi:hypothetical protein
VFLALALALSQDKLVASAPSRVVVVSSLAHEKTYEPEGIRIHQFRSIRVCGNVQRQMAMLFMVVLHCTTYNKFEEKFICCNRKHRCPYHLKNIYIISRTLVKFFVRSGLKTIQKENINRTQKINQKQGFSLLPATNKHE